MCLILKNSLLFQFAPLSIEKIKSILEEILISLSMTKIKMAMIGGGQGAFIGEVHRLAANLDAKIELLAGAFSSDARKSTTTGQELGLDPKRVYASFEQMLQVESQLPASEKIDFVSIVTPNFLHFEPVKQALELGFHVMCEKPLAFNVTEAEALRAIQAKTGKIVALTHNYTGYPMVKEAKNLVAQGRLGKVRKVIVEYPQGWLSAPIEQSGQKQADWRTDPKRAGISCCVGDIGTHAENLTEYITGLKITSLCADVNTFVEGRLLDDDANVLIRLSNGAKGVLIASQIANGEENELKIRIYGEKASLEWLQSEPNSLILKSNDAPKQILRTGGYPWLSSQTNKHTRLPGGHPEGYLESMANLYRNFAHRIECEKNNQEADPELDFPSLEDGVRGMKFIEAVIQSSSNNSTWVELK